MDINNLLVLLLIISNTCFGITLFRHVMFKKRLFKLKQDMKNHTSVHGIDNGLWEMFLERTNKMLRFWS